MTSGDDGGRSDRRSWRFLAGFIAGAAVSGLLLWLIETNNWFGA